MKHTILALLSATSLVGSGVLYAAPTLQGEYLVTATGSVVELPCSVSFPVTDLGVIKSTANATSTPVEVAATVVCTNPATLKFDVLDSNTTLNGESLTWSTGRDGTAYRSTTHSNISLKVLDANKAAITPVSPSTAAGENSQSATISTTNTGTVVPLYWVSMQAGNAVSTPDNLTSSFTVRVTYP